MFEDIIKSCKYVTKNAQSVKINYNKIDEIVQNDFNISSISHWLKEVPFGVFDLDIEQIVEFLLIYHAIGFSYWGNPTKWSIEAGEFGTLDGSYAMMYCLINELKSNPNFLNVSNLRVIKLEDLRRIEIPLLAQRHSNIAQIGQIIQNKMNGNFYNSIYRINDDISLFNFIIKNFNFFEDVRMYKGKKIYFYKLAQLLTSDILHVREIKENLHVDYSHLVGCADYKIPQILRALGILEYNTELSKIISQRQEINENSPYEVEIRASMLIVIDYIKNIVGNNVNAMDINDFIWLKSQDKSIIMEPYHLTRTTAY